MRFAAAFVGFSGGRSGVAVGLVFGLISPWFVRETRMRGTYLIAVLAVLALALA